MARCARTSAKGGGDLDRHGICGAACSCGVPVLSSWVTMTTAEQFAYYPHVLEAVLEERELQLYGMDNACHFKKYLENRCVLRESASGGAVGG